MTGVKIREMRSLSERYVKAPFFIGGVAFAVFALVLGTWSYAKGPAGWFLSGSGAKDYSIGLDKNVKHKGKASGFLRSKSTWKRGFGTMMQIILADRFRGKRVRLSGWLKTQDVRQWAGMWMRVDGKKGKILAFDNMQRRFLRGTLAWKSYDIVLDVPKNASRIAFGVLLSGPGRVWVDALKMEKVSLKVPTTVKPRIILPKVPQNLNFEK